MKTSGVLVVMILLTGCSYLPFRQNIHSIATTVDSFELSRTVSVGEVKPADRLVSGDTALFIEFGCDSTLVAEYRRGDERYSAEVLSFLTPKGALGAYMLSGLRGSTPLEIGYASRINASMVQFVKTNYFITVSVKSGGNMNGAELLAEKLTKRIRKLSIKPELYETLPQNAIVADTGLYFMGPRAFSERFPRDLADSILLLDAVEGFSAKYDYGNGTVDLLKVRYASPEKTLLAENAYLKSRAQRPVIIPGNNLKYYRVVESDRTEVYIADYADWLYLMIGADPSGKAREIFEYTLRGGK